MTMTPPRISPAIRISLGLSLFTFTLLMVVEMLGFLPDPQLAVLDARKKTCESLAVYASLAIQSGDLDAIQTTMNVLKDRNADILSTALRQKNGRILAVTGDHDHHWQNSEVKTSTLQNVQVPIFRGEDRWGSFEVCFQPLHASTLQRLWNLPLVKIMALVMPLGFVGFLLIMKKTLRYLDPSAVVPERVKVTLDSLVEGVVLMDSRERIVLTNKAFEENLGRDPSAILGRKASELNLQLPPSLEGTEAFPWQHAIREGARQSAIPLSVKDKDGKRRTFMASGAPIIDAKGNTRGALATFDDVTQLEVQNSKLQLMLGELKKSRDEVHRQNEALQILATQDPLTGCLNRRAFFERFEVEFNRARRYRHNLACIMTDIDHFKRVNDQHGHQVGDEVLQQVAAVLRSALRDTDVVCRYGGEEFCLILTETGAEGARNTAERIRQTVANKAINDIRVTLSLGVVSLEDPAANPSELLGFADKALYRAKNSGRNQVVTYQKEIDERVAETSDEKGQTKAASQAGGKHIPRHVVTALMLALEHRDAATAEHSRKVGELCAALARDLVPINECDLLEVAGQLHDIGKLGVPDAILLKPGPLTEAEWQVLQAHERRSVDVIAATFMSPELVDIVRYHSHWYDGSSSEDASQPSGEGLSLGARILHIANAFDAMTSQRPYRDAMDTSEAFAELRRCAGTQFDPQLVERFIQMVTARDDSRRPNQSDIPTAVKLEIGRVVEKLLAEVNTAAWNDVKLSAELLGSLAEKHDLAAIAAVAREIESAARKNRGQIEIIELTSKLLGVCGSLKAEDAALAAHSKAA
ncbi:MAG: diguanylate cyclase [Desulfosarcinaceae bacterium]|nr:diguanylate cyclase [Desulfosarcinaceae bacterium]